MRRWFCCMIFCLGYGASLYADPMTIYTTCSGTVYARMCYIKSMQEPWLPASDILEFAPCSRMVVARPPRKYHWYGWYDRYLIFADTKEALEQPQVPDPAQLIAIGSMHGSDFYLDNRHGIVQGYNAIAWNMRMVHEALEAAFCYMVHEIKQEHGEHLYSTLKAYVRPGTDLCPQEQAYLVQRSAKAAAAGKKIMQHIIPQVTSYTMSKEAPWPRIALCTSGGGYRAMICTLGWLQGAEKCGLLDAATYIATLSGSTWAVAGWIESALGIDAYSSLCTEHIETSFLYDHDHDQVADALLKQFVFTQNLSLIDFYGALLAQKILKPYVHNPHEIDLAAQAEKIAGGKQLFPLYTAVLDVGKAPYEWVEFSPYEIASDYLGAAIPTWSFGRTFYGGVSTNFAPSQSLGFYMGIWGSVLSANIKDLLQRYARLLGPELVVRLLQNIAQHISLAEGRVTAAQVPNWTFWTTLPHSDERQLQLLDAGLDYNVPLIPLLKPERAVDIIIILDATYLGGNGSELVRAQAYAERHGIPFPPIDYTKMHEVCSVHADWGNPDLPVILYIPLRKYATYEQGWDPYQHDFISTFNFKYTKEQMKLLSGLTEHSMMLSQPTIFETIARVVARKLQSQVN